MLLDLARTISFLLTIFSLVVLFHTAFFAFAMTWQQRLFAAIIRVTLAAGIAIASGLLFRQTADSALPLAKTLPVRVFLWALVGMMVLFALAWYLDVYYMPQRRVLGLYCLSFIA